VQYATKSSTPTALGPNERIGSASGKVILVGEHAVVYGSPAIVVGIDRGATAWASAEADGVSRLVIGDAPPVALDGDSDLARAFAALLDACGVTVPVRVQAETELPAGAGLGCSAALGVAIARALDVFMGRPAQAPGDVTRSARAWEAVFHGNPSGVDAAAAARGGCLFFRKNGPSGASIKHVRLSAPLTLAIGHSGQSSSTRAMVELVAELREKKASIVDRSVAAIASLVENARLALEAGDHVGLGRLMDLNQMLLSGLLLSTEEIETMCRLAREAGALGAKLTGSGGGGCVVALAEDAGPILAAWQKEGFRSFSTRVSPDGEPVRSSAGDGS
jgi:mevalonate kinase